MLIWRLTHPRDPHTWCYYCIEIVLSLFSFLKQKII